MRFLDPDVNKAARLHAMECYPNESCGAVTAAGYIPFENLHPDPTRYFDCDDQMEPLITSGELLALVHSHPGGPHGPSAYDMAQQIAMNVPWGIVVCSKDAALPVYFWGDMLPRQPLIGRDFRHGPSGTDNKGDCYALIRDWFLVERGVHLADFPRDDDWWKKEGGDLYRDNFAAWGFQVDARFAADPKVGDILLIQYHARTPNHGAIYVGNGTILHHLGSRVSREEPLVRWKNLVCSWVRYAP
jgi:proteasome lid subunit RPN8/RPN11